jgi:hypothetical protein
MIRPWTWFGLALLTGILVGVLTNDVIMPALVSWRWFDAAAFVAIWGPVPIGNVVERGSGATTGTLANGDTVVVRDKSTKDGRPTLEVHHKGEIIVKVRYGSKPPPR